MEAHISGSPSNKERTQWLHSQLVFALNLTMLAFASQQAIHASSCNNEGREIGTNKK